MSLPPCPARHFFADESQVFFCAHPLHHSQDNLVTEEVCQICPYWRQPPPSEFRPIPQVRPIPRHGPCQHLGTQVGLRDCASCGGHVRVKTFACSHPAHRETTLAACARCPDYVGLVQPLAERRSGSSTG